MVNYTADSLFGGRGDFGFLLSGYPRIVVHGIALLTIFLALSAAAREILLAHPLKLLSIESKPSLVS